MRRGARRGLSTSRCGRVLARSGLRGMAQLSNCHGVDDGSDRCDAFFERIRRGFRVYDCEAILEVVDGEGHTLRFAENRDDSCRRGKVSQLGVWLSISVK